MKRFKSLIGRIWSIVPRRYQTRAIRSTQGRFTASVAAIVFDEEGRVLLLDHVLRAGTNWGLPGGFLEHGEQPEDAIRREVAEEADIELENLSLYRVRTIHCHVEVLFVGQGLGEARVNSHEIKGVGWFLPAKLPEGVSVVQQGLIIRVASEYPDLSEVTVSETSP